MNLTKYYLKIITMIDIILYMYTIEISTYDRACAKYLNLTALLNKTQLT